jgi:hypothetical protein
MFKLCIALRADAVRRFQSFKSWLRMALGGRNMSQQWKKLWFEWRFVRNVYVALQTESSERVMICFIMEIIYFYLACEAIGTAATPGLLCQPRVTVKMIVEKQMKCRLAGETEVLGENLPPRHFCPAQNPTWPDPGLNPGRRGGKPATNRLSYGAA